MKRSSTLTKGKRSGNILKDLTKEQLAGVGMVALAYNEAESHIHYIVGLGFDLKHLVAEFTQRVNGITGLCELAKLIIKNLGAKDEVLSAFSDTLGASGFEQLKSYRDAVIHCRIFDADSSIAISPGKRGRFNEILLTKQALNGLYERLTIINYELICFCNIMIKLQEIKIQSGLANYCDHMIPAIIKDHDLATAYSKLALSARDTQKSNIESEIRVQMAQALHYQQLRSSLPPLPEFPSEF